MNSKIKNQQSKMRSAFTLVELLVVVSIIVVLITLLMPAMDKAIDATSTARCLANQHAIGQALSLYHYDAKQRYPQMSIWWDLLGARDINGFDDVTQRPLNAYLGYTTDGTDVPVARCPSDLGDPGADEDPNTFIENTYKWGGTSYVQAWHALPNEPYGIAGVKLVFGSNGDVLKYRSTVSAFNTPWTSVKLTSLTRLDNKFINADWPWHNNRYTYEPRLRWHKQELEERIFSTLFADGHADLLNMDKYIVDPKYNPNASAVPYDASRAWW